MSTRGKASDTICWECAKACGGCSWSVNFTPVEGWTAENTVNAAGVKSYIVQECPEYVKEKRENRDPEMLDTQRCVEMIERLLEVTRIDYIKGNNKTQKEIESFLRGKGAAKVHMIQDPEAVIAMLKKASIQHRKRMAQLII